MKQGKWVVLEDIDRGSSEVLGVIKPLAKSLRVDKWIGGCGAIDVPGHGRVAAAHDFALFATRSVPPSKNGDFPPAAFFGAHKFHEVQIPAPTADELQLIIDTRFPRLAGALAKSLIHLWHAVIALGSTASEFPKETTSERRNILPIIPPPPAIYPSLAVHRPLSVAHSYVASWITRDKP
ncbi:hypothetical protein AB1N83_013387 [Pleurotus pulmonarius]